MFVILNECEESRIACGAVPARDPSAATPCQDDKRRLGKHLYYLLNLFSPPDDIARILRHAAAAGVAVVLTKLVGNALAVNSPAVGGGANKIDGIIYTHIGQGLGIVVEGFFGEGLDHEDATSHIADTTTDGLALRLIEYGRAIVYQRILAEEIAATLGSLLEQGRISGYAHSDIAIDRGTISFLR